MLVKSINLQLVGNKQVGLPITYYMEKNLPIVRKVRGGWGVSILRARGPGGARVNKYGDQ